MIALCIAVNQLLTGQFHSSYVDDLSVKKQDKALIHARRARNIRTVLIDPKDTAIESAQFRYVPRSGPNSCSKTRGLVRISAELCELDFGSRRCSSFRLLVSGILMSVSIPTLRRAALIPYALQCTKMVCHEGKPVAIREKLFKILTKAHQQCQHGGRDKTSAQVRRIYSW